MTPNNPPVIYRYEVPVDDQWHAVTGCSTPLYVASRTPETVEFWAWKRTDLHPRFFRVYGTGQPVTDDGLDAGYEPEYRGTALAAGGRLVWHLFEGCP